MKSSSDLEEIDHVAARFFGAFDNRHGRVPSVQAMAELFAPGAIVVRDTGAICESCSVLAFAEPRVRLLTNGELLDFHEWETSAATAIMGSVAQRTSTYAKAGLLREQEYAGSGQKLFHFGRFPEGWRITAIAWSDG